MDGTSPSASPGYSSVYIFARSPPSPRLQYVPGRVFTAATLTAVTICAALLLICVCLGCGWHRRQAKAAGVQKGGAEWNENIVVVINPNSHIEMGTKVVLNTAEGQKQDSDRGALEKCPSPPTPGNTGTPRLVELFGRRHVHMSGVPQQQLTRPSLSRSSEGPVSIFVIDTRQFNVTPLSS